MRHEVAGAREVRGSPSGGLRSAAGDRASAFVAKYRLRVGVLPGRTHAAMTAVLPLARLGDLEAAVMEHVWAHGPCDVKAAHRTLGARRKITLNTVQSTMERLFRKGLLARAKVSHAYVYSPRQTREELGARVVEEVIARLLQGEAVPVLEAFVDLAARTDAANLDRLERLIAARRRAER